MSKLRQEVTPPTTIAETTTSTNVATNRAAAKINGSMATAYTVPNAKSINLLKLSTLKSKRPNLQQMQKQ